MSHYISKRTSQLETGDIVHCHGMRLLIDQPLETSQSHPVGDHGPCLWTKALVLNPDEVRAAQVVPSSWLYEDRWIEGRGWVSGHELGEEPRWAIQGNDLATWAIEAHPGGSDCHFTIEPGTCHGSFACGEAR